MHLTINNIPHILGFSHKHNVLMGNGPDGDHMRTFTVAHLKVNPTLESAPPPDKTLVGEAFAYVHPNDNFCKATGRKIALKKLLSGVERDVRRQVWEQYWSVVKH